MSPKNKFLLNITPSNTPSFLVNHIKQRRRVKPACPSMAYLLYMLHLPH